MVHLVETKVRSLVKTELDLRQFFGRHQFCGIWLKHSDTISNGIITNGIIAYGIIKRTYLLRVVIQIRIRIAGSATFLKTKLKYDHRCYQGICDG